MIKFYWRCRLRSIRSRVYLTIRCLSVCLSVCIRLSVASIDSSSGVRRVCCWAPCGQEISIDGCGRAVSAVQQVPRRAYGAGAQQQRRRSRRQRLAVSSKCWQCHVDSQRRRLNTDLLCYNTFSKGKRVIRLLWQACMLVSMPVPNFTNFYACYLLQWLGPPLAAFAICYILNSDFVNDITFTHNGHHGSMSLPLQQRHCSVVNWLTTLLRRNFLVV